MKRNKVRSRPERVRAEQLDLRVLELRARGRSFREIASECKVSVAGAFKAFQRAMAAHRELVAESAQDNRDLMLQQIDAIIASVWKQATTEYPDHECSFGPKLNERQFKAADRILKALEQRAKLLGLDAQAKGQLEISGHLFTGLDPGVVEERIKALLAKREQES